MNQQSASATAEVEEEDSKPQSVSELIQEIIAMSGISEEDAENLPTGRRLVSGSGKLWNLAGGVPGRDEDLLIIGLFCAEEDAFARAYCVPKRAQDKDSQPITPSRFLVSMTGPGVFFQSMPLDTLESEMAEEIADLYGVVGARLREDCGVESCGFSNEASARFCSECGVKMPEDEPETPPAPPPPPPARPS